MFFPVTHLHDMGVIKLMAPLRQHGMLDALIMRIRDQFDQLLLLQQLECGIDRLTAEIQLFAYLALGTGPSPIRTRDQYSLTDRPQALANCPYRLSSALLALRNERSVCRSSD